jgi:hypothetical protein
MVSDEADAERLGKVLHDGPLKVELRPGLVIRVWIFEVESEACGSGNFQAQLGIEPSYSRKDCRCNNRRFCLWLPSARARRKESDSFSHQGDIETVKFVETFGMTETLFDAALDAHFRDCPEITAHMVWVHDLKHTFGRRLRAAGVSFEDRQDLLGHRSGRITTHYSAAELSRLIEAADRVVERDGKRPELVVLRGAISSPSRKTPASAIGARGTTSLSH